MKEKRNFLSKLLGTKSDTFTKTTYQVFNGYNSVYTAFGEDFFENDVVRSCIDTIARHCAKFEPRHVRVANGQRQYINGDINFLLSNQPNPVMTTYDFNYKTIAMKYIRNNVFVFIDKRNGMIDGYYPVNCATSEFLRDSADNLYVRFWLLNGQTYTLPYEDLIHLRRFYNNDNLFGENNEALKKPVQTQHTADEGIANAIKTSTSLRGIIQYTQNLKEADVKKNRDNFVKDFLDMENTSGIAALDAKGEFKELNIEPITLDKDQLAHVDQRVLNYFGMNKSILSSDFTAEQWNAFFESVLEPDAIYLGQSFTNKTFNKNTIKKGDKIEFLVNRVQYASSETKIKIVKEAGALGVLTIDQALAILDLPTIGGEEGAKRLQSLNFVNALLADKYQMEGNKNGESN